MLPSRTCWVNETIEFIINKSKTSQILIVTNSTQALINGHYIMISTDSCIPWYIFPNFVRSKNLQILPKKNRNFSQKYTEKTNFGPKLSLKKISACCKNSLSIAYNCKSNTQYSTCSQRPP
jgi:hypothetical protein